MAWIDKLERRLGFIAIPGLLRYVAALTALVFVLYKLNPQFLAMIDLDARAVRSGEVWRLVSYIFIPGLGSLLPMPDWINAAFSVLFLIWVGDRLEVEWGSFRVTLFFLVGMIGTTVAAFFFGQHFSNGMLMSSLFFAFARFYPDLVIFVGYILPAKVKWVAWAYAAILLWQFLFGNLAYRSAMLVAFANYILFFGRDIFQQARHRGEVSARRQRFQTDVSVTSDQPLHTCKVCGATEVSHPDLEFRVARDGEEYCVPHLPSAQNVVATGPGQVGA